MINIYIDTNYKGLKGRMEYGHFLEWVKEGKVMNRPGDGKSNIVFGEVVDTRNRAFLRATIEAIERISLPKKNEKQEPICVYAPCDYLITSMAQNKPRQWIIDGWIKGDKKEVKNRDLWRKLLDVIGRKDIVEMEWKCGPHKLSLDIVRGIESKYERPITNGD